MKLIRFKFAPVTLILIALAFSLCWILLSDSQPPGDWEAHHDRSLDILAVTRAADIILPSIAIASPIAALDRSDYQTPKQRDVAQVKALRKKISTLDAVDDELMVQWNLESLDRLIRCLDASDCAIGQEKVILLASYHFAAARTGRTSGETIWAASTTRALQALNYTLLWSWDAPHTLLQYQYIPDMIRIVIWEPSELQRCVRGDVTSLEGALEDHMWDGNGAGRSGSDFLLQDHQSMDETSMADLDEGRPRSRQESLSSTAPVGNAAAVGCIKTAQYLHGIPIWKSFAFHFWGDSQSPLGAMWTLSPYDRGNWKSSDSNQFLGYSIEHTCRGREVQAVKKPQGLLLGKFSHYFRPPEMSFPHMLQGVAGGINISSPEVLRSNKSGTPHFTFVATPLLGEDETLEEEGLTLLAIQEQKAWIDLLGESTVLVGLGWPQLSPSPYDALCLGVPFINVIESWDEDDPDDRQKWLTQHNALLPLDPPYVYHVRARDANALQFAVQAAIDNPIERFIAPGMGENEVMERHRLLVETDWLLWAEEFIDAEWGNTPTDFLL